MKKGGIFLLLFFLSNPIFAQTGMEQMFQKDNPNILYQNEARPTQGETLAYIEGISDKPQPKTWKDKLKIKLFGSMDISKKDLSPELDATPTEFDNGTKDVVEIQPAFGPKRQEAFVPHTADWRFIITTSNDQSVVFQEELIFVLSEDSENLIKDWPVLKKNFQPLGARLDGTPIAFDPKEETESIFWALPPLKTGTHQLHLNYILTQPFHQNQLTLPLIGKKWPLMTNGFSGIILANNAYQIKDLKFLVGTNQQEYPENFTFQRDAHNNILFKTGKILPLNMQIQLVGETDKAPNESLFNQKSDTLIFFIALGILGLYLILSGLEIKKMPFEKMLKKFRHQSSYTLINWIYRIYETLIGSCLLLILTKLFSSFFEIPLLSYQWCILIFSALAGLIVLDIGILLPAQKEVKFIHQNQKKRSLI